MRQSAFKNITTFILVLLSTVLIVLSLSFASRVSAHSAETYSFSAEVTDNLELSAKVPEDNDINLTTVMTFALVLALPIAFLLSYLRIRNRKPKRAYSYVSSSNSDVTYNKKYKTKKYKL